VIIPAYNSERYIRETIDGVLKQTYRDFEIVVVDDGSTDATPLVVDQIEDPRIRLLRKANGGSASARNVGIANSSGEYLQFLDADDLILPGKLMRQVELLDTHPLVDVVYCSFRNFYADRCDLHPPEWLRPPSDDPYRELVAGSIFPLHAALVRRTCAEAVGLFNTKLVSAEDWDFWIRIARAGSAFIFHDELFALYRQHAASKTKRRARWRQAHVQIMENLRQLAGDGQELQRINWYYNASFNYVLYALAVMSEGEESRVSELLKRAYTLDSELGHAPGALAIRIAEHALAYDANLSAHPGSDGSSWLESFGNCLPGEYPSRAVMRAAWGLYWHAMAHLAHAGGPGREVRKYLWRAFKTGGTKGFNRGTLSILLQSVLGKANWNHLKGSVRLGNN
jgi:glycosyltransferase involved in cell wall biosynthesis